MELNALRVRDARQLVDRVDATDITDPDLPHVTAVELIARLKVTAEILADALEAQQAHTDKLQASLREAKARVVELEAAALDAEDLAAA